MRSAIGAVERTRVEELSKANDARAQALLRIIDNPVHALTPIHLLNSFSLLLIATAATWRALLSNTATFSILSQLALVGLVLIAGKVLAGVIGTSNALLLARFSTGPVLFLLRLASPFLSFGAWLYRVARGSRARTRATDRVTTDDIQIIVAEGEQSRKLELIDADEREMIASIIEMGERYASEIMIPRIDVVGLEVNSSLEEALDIATEHGHSRLPVYEESIDHVVGILHVKDLLPVLRHPHPEREVQLRELLRPVHYVPDTAKTDDLLRDLLRNRVHMAVVVDEYGGTAGIVTIEDVLEEIVGEIRDEYDVAEPPAYERISDDEVLFSARVPVTEVNELMSLQLPTEENDTIGGLVYTQLGRIPNVGDSVRVGPVELTVTSVNGQRLEQVRVRYLQSDGLSGNEKEEADAKLPE